MLKFHEHTAPDGTLVPVALVIDDGDVCLAQGDDVYPLPERALDVVMARYGAPFDPDEPVLDIASLDLGGASVRHVRHLARFDVIARDYLVVQPPAGSDAPPLCALATTVAVALMALARAAQHAEHAKGEHTDDADVQNAK